MFIHSSFMRAFIPCKIRSEEKVSLTKINSKTLLNKKNTYLFKMFYVLPHIIKEVDISEELYSQQLIHRSQSNPELRENKVNNFSISMIFQDACL